MIDFIDREEYMMIQLSNIPNEKPEPERWEGPGK